MLRLIFISFVIFFIQACSSRVSVEDVPVEERVASACIARALGIDRICDFALGIVEDVDGKPSTILVEKSIRKDGEEKTKWLVTDQIPYPDVKPNQHLAMSTCRQDKVRDDAILAVVNDADEEWLVAEGWAGKIDFDSGKFKPIDARNVDCENEAWGI